MNLQYTVHSRPVCGFTIRLYADGALRETLVVALERNLEEACKSVEDAGYVRAYDVQACRDRMLALEKAYRGMQAEYEKALASPLMYSDPQAYSYKIRECEIPGHVTITKYYRDVARSIDVVPNVDLDRCIEELERKGYKRLPD